MFNKKIFLIPLAIVFFSLGTGCSSNKTPTPTPQGYNVKQQNIIQKIVPLPSQLGAIESNSEGIIIDAGNKDWNKVGSRLKVIKTNFNQLKPLMQMNATSKKIINDMGKSLNNLEKQVSAKKEYETMLVANALTKIMPDATDIFKPSTSTNFGRLSYLGREIDLNADKNAWTSAKANFNKIDKIWASLKPKISSTYSSDISKFNITLSDLSKSITDKNSGVVKGNVKLMLERVILLESDLSKQANSQLF